jgi:hypothetical protein
VISSGIIITYVLKLLFHLKHLYLPIVGENFKFSPPPAPAHRARLCSVSMLDPEAKLKTVSSAWWCFPCRKFEGLFKWMDIAVSWGC